MAESAEARTAVRRLVEYIKKNRLSDGDQLPPIPQLAAELDLGRNVTRDALLLAQSLGIIKIHPRLGTFVKSPDLSPMVDALTETMELALMREDENLVHLIEARYMLERELVAAATKRRQPENLFPVYKALQDMAASADNRQQYVDADERFHVAIARISGNEVMVVLLRALLVLLRPYRASMLLSEEELRETSETHSRIYESIVQGDPDLAREEMEKHLMHGKLQVIEKLSAPVSREPGSGTSTNGMSSSFPV